MSKGEKKPFEKQNERQHHTDARSAKEIEKAQILIDVEKMMYTKARKAGHSDFEARQLALVAISGLKFLELFHTDQKDAS